MYYLLRFFLHLNTVLKVARCCHCSYTRVHSTRQGLMFQVADTLRWPTTRSTSGSYTWTARASAPGGEVLVLYIHMDVRETQTLGRPELSSRWVSDGAVHTYDCPAWASWAWQGQAAFEYRSIARVSRLPGGSGWPDQMRAQMCGS